MAGEDFEYEPLANFIRGIAEDDPEPTPHELPVILSRRGLDSDAVAGEVESRISAYLQRQRPVESVHVPGKWKHPSILLFAEGGNPVEKMISLATEFVLGALEGLTQAAAIDPFRLANLKHIPVIANEAIADARLVPLMNDRFQIEYNPNQPRSRIRFSIAHELAHTFFPDCHKVVRSRQSREHFEPNEWELEMLCNIGAAELLMPMASFPQLRAEALNIDTLMVLKEKFEVSAEALLIRIAHVTNEPCSMFAASRIERGDLMGRYHLDYAIRSRSWRAIQPFSELLPRNTAVAECTAIGFTAKGDESWSPFGPLHVECVGILPYRGARFPRVVGIIQPMGKGSERGVRIIYLKGDATQPRGSGPRIIAHNINDKAISWGAGFARAIAAKWPRAQEEFKRWVFTNKSALRLGNTFKTQVENNLWTFQMVCQHGYGPAGAQRIRYGALKSCLEELARFAIELNATVHMPRLGTGYGGAAWGIVSEIIDETVCRVGVPVTIYDLPNRNPEMAPELPGLFGCPWHDSD
jgi:Zn-dependent peptidase ImmA (M78 family)/O-acetyl-ADP-ribose deacetylase (regulator of RNase III)